MDEDDDRSQAARILDAALRLGERDGWDAVHLHDVARETNLALADIRRHYRHKDDLADAWFDRAELARVASLDEPCCPDDVGEPDQSFHGRRADLARLLDDDHRPGQGGCRAG